MSAIFVRNNLHKVIVGAELSHLLKNTPIKEATGCLPPKEPITGFFIGLTISNLVLLVSTVLWLMPLVQTLFT
jgi:hypothetical protein